MRASILAWSTFSGLLLGAFIDVALVAIWMIASAVVPALGSRLATRWIVIAATTTLGLIPIAGALVGFFEGKLKA
jgi:hypothetical protein